MKLEKLSVKNFRTLENISVNFFGYYTAISGRNNAGKTTLIKVLRNTFRENKGRYFYFEDDRGVTYADDKTQWVEGNPPIEFKCEITVERSSDPGLFVFIEKFHGKSVAGDHLSLHIVITHDEKDNRKCICSVGGTVLGNFESNEILQKLQSSNLMFMHDSANHSAAPIFVRGGKLLHELPFSADERRQISDEQKRLQNKIKGISKVHRSELSELLGHLEDKYEVEFTIPEGMFGGSLPFGTNLKDKNVDVPLSDWGSGTKNKTNIMMSILQANRIKTKADENKITPFMIIEEPESFLHPSAQAEFGRVLRDLANELRIQTIVTTHSPYMLCQEKIASNILLDRKLVRGKLKQSEVIEVKEQTWMEPFSEILGLDNTEFNAWKEVLLSAKSCVLLVEGEIDKKYYEHINCLKLAGFELPENLDIVPYEGKDALKNTILLKFIVEKFKRVFITFDLDAKPELERIMQQIGLVEGVNYLPVGLDRAGKQCMEGLLPERILSKVYAANTDLVMQLSAADTKDRKSAKSALKQKLLAEFKADKTITAEDLRPFASYFKCIIKQLG